MCKGVEWLQLIWESQSSKFIAGNSGDYCALSPAQ